MKTFTCPKCGGTLQYDERKDILSCPYCGAAIEREGNVVDKVIRYKERKELRKLDETKRQEQRVQEGIDKLRILLIVMIIGAVLMHYLK